MSEPHREAIAVDAPADGEPAADASPAGAPAPRSNARSRAFSAAALVIAVLALVAAFGAPLLPWNAAGSSDAALGERLDRLDAGLQQREQQQQQREQQLRQEIAAANAALTRLDRRIAAVEGRPAVAATDIAEARQQLGQMAATNATLAARVEALDKVVHAQAAGERTDAALPLALLRLNEAIATGRPFAAELETLTTLARRRPEVAAAAQPLAEPAKSGVATHAVLTKRLHELAPSIATAGEQPAGGGWSDAALARLEGLVKIRRIDGAPPSGPAAVNAAELALAGGDLDDAIAALDKLSGAAGEAAQPWLGMARQRAAVETALQRIEAALVARLGASDAVAPAGK